MRVFILKTNQVMTVTFEHGSIDIGHKTSIGSLTDVFIVGNRCRFAEGKTIANITQFCNSGKTQEFIEEVSKKIGLPVNELLYTTGKGKNARVMANIFIMIYAAEYLSTAFHVEVIDTFINNKLLTWRDDGGDHFKQLNDNIVSAASDLLGKPAHKGHFVTIAKIINKRIGDGVDWNTASKEQLAERDRIECALSTVIKLGLVKDWEHLKQLACDC